MKHAKGLWYYAKNYKFNSLFFRNFILIIALIILPIATIGYIFYNNTKSLMKEEITTSNISALYRIRDVSDTIIKEVDMLATNTSLQSNVNIFMLSSDFDLIIEDIKNRVGEFTKMYTLVYKYIDSIYIYSEKNNKVIGNNENIEVDEFKDNNWIDRYKRDKDKLISIQARKKNNSFPHFISIVKPVRFGQQNAVGGIIANINVKEFGKLIMSKDNPGAQNVFIVDGEENVIYSELRENFAKKASDVNYIKDVYIKESGFSSEMPIDGEASIVSVLSSQYYDIKYISIIPLTYYEAKINRMAGFMVNIILIALVIGAVMAFLISTRTYQPIRSIMEVIENEENWEMNYGNTKGNVIEENSNNLTHNNVSYNNTNNNAKLNTQKNSKNIYNANNDELKFIVNNIVKTIRSNKEMEQELERRLALLGKAQFTALQAQINPHFLYNTLEAINFMALELTNSKNKVSNTVVRLANLLRLGLDSESYLISIREEIEHASNYIEILKIRYKDIFAVEWNIDDKILDCKIIKLCLQPLIENAIYHGIKPKDDHGIVKITGEFVEEGILIKVTDDGVGMDSEKLEELNKSMEEQYSLSGQHIGVRNVNQRIKIIFGEKYGIKISSIENGGTVVEVLIPVIE